MKTLRITHVIVILCIIYLPIHAQKMPIKFGEVDMADLQMTKYDADPDAEAVVLCDYGQLNFRFNQTDGQWLQELKRTCRIKILTTDGYDFATISKSLYGKGERKEELNQLKGFTYNLENGKLIKSKLEKENIFEEKTSEYYTSMKFTLPNVKEGSVIEFTYVISSNMWTILDSWYFQRSIPIRWSEYYVSIPDYFTYMKNSTGFGSFSQFETNSKAAAITWTEVQRSNMTLNGGSGGGISSGKVDYTENTMHWIAKDVPALRDESFVGNYRNYFLGVDFQLSSFKHFNGTIENVLGNWNEVVKELTESEDFGPNMNKKGFYKDVTDAIMAKYTEPTDRMAAVYSFVSSNTKWNEKSWFIPSQNIKKTYDEKSGNCADINALLVSMLRAVDLVAAPVILSTVENGKVHPTYPILDKYNYLIAKVTLGAGYVLLDATEDDLPVGLLPMRCLNQVGYTISEDRPGWVDIVPQKSLEKATMCVMKVNEEGQMTGSVSYKLSGYEAVNIREILERDGTDKFKENFTSSHPEWTISSLDIDAPEAASEPVKEIIKTDLSNAAQSAGNIIYINPILCDKIEENPLKQEKREMPIEFIVPIKQSYMLNLTIPEGYVVDELPQSVNMVIPDKTAQLKYVVKAVGNNIQLIMNWEISESFYAPTKFPDLKEFYATLVAKQNEQIVLKKASAN
jgi:transglutaminase-like putative cysteine protease